MALWFGVMARTVELHQEAEQNRVLAFVCHNTFPDVVSLFLSRIL